MSILTGPAIDRRSITGYSFMLGNNPISWSSWKQPTVALSSTEGEYMAATEASREAIYLRRLLSDLGFPQTSPTTLYMDNQSAIQISRTSLIAHSNRTKHIDTQHHWIREQVQNNVIDPQYIPTIDQTADILTKACRRQRLKNFAMTSVLYLPDLAEEGVLEYQPIR